MNIQLSISLLASDKPAALERCLDSLRPLLMQVPSELIVVATGTDGKVRETAARYTGQIIPFVWCGDFSAARNAGLQAAKGEWFLYIDDDEWFEDTAEIRDFFLTGEYKKYGTAFYRVRNYLARDGVQYFDFHALRMARISHGVAFHNPIHEELSPRLGTSKFFDAYVHHYGYIVEKNRAGTGKTSRNIPMLLQNIRRNPDYIKNYIQITQEYYVRKEWGKAEEYCRKGRRLCRGKAGAEWYVQWFQVYWAEIQCSKGDAGQARKEILSILEKEKPGGLTRLCLYRKLLLLCTQLKKHDETLRYGKEFENLLSYIDKEPQIWEQQSYGDINEARIKKPEDLALGRVRCAQAAFYLKDSGQAVSFLKLLPWEDEAHMQKYYPLFDKWKGEDAAAFREIMGALPIQNPYLVFQEALSAGADGGNPQQATQLLSCMSQTVSPYLLQQVLENAILLEMDLSPFANALDLGMWNGCMQQIAGRLPLSRLPAIEKAAQALQETAPLQGLWLEKLALEKWLTHRYPLADELIIGLSKYCQCVISYYKKQYRKEMFVERGGEALPDDCRFAILALEALAQIDGQRYPEAVSLFRSSLKFYPAMTGVIQDLIRQIRNGMGNPAKGAGEEFQALAARMKQNLLVLAEAGQYDAADHVMGQLSALLPEDLELLRIRQDILGKMNRMKADTNPILK